ncbi:MAG: ATP-binding cassette domain-containing protein [Candidatus Gastranaerophilales bacterium]|nr:ATP-binding cassette domain-containing protein [Candidatus Gastranaerophilales bacterium]
MNVIENTPIVETSGLSKGAAINPRVRDLHLEVSYHCVYGFLGPNGAGKTTTLKLLLGLIRQDKGKIYLFGREVTDQNRLSLLRKIGSLIESPSFYGHLTGVENMQIVAKLKNVPFQEIKKALETVRLTSRQDQKVKHYSLGMKQRLGIAMALLGDPELLILDEPTNGLDPAGIQEMRELIKSLPATREMTVIVSSHLLNEMEQIADHVGIIHRGEMIFQGTQEELHCQGESLEEIFLSLTGGADSL